MIEILGQDVQPDVTPVTPTQGDQPVAPTPTPEAEPMPTPEVVPTTPEVAPEAEPMPTPVAPETPDQNGGETPTGDQPVV